MSSVIPSTSRVACSTSCLRVLAGQHGRLEQGQQPRERRAELVRDRGREPGAQLLVCREVALAREVDEPLAPPVDLVRDDERDHAARAAP